MSSNEKDINEGIDFSEKKFKQRFKQIDREQLPAIVRNASARESKSRITIHLDSNVINYFKELAEKTDEGYQTLINRALRQFVDNQSLTTRIFDELDKEMFMTCSGFDIESKVSEWLKQSILNDKSFLSKLEEAMHKQ
ncbi:MAG TPA: BrnA antitoxin family protein [Pyrinomonadaceae bacterium]|jgi:uncharacterized protein (DUF4415 family)